MVLLIIFASNGASPLVRRVLNIIKGKRYE